MRRSPLLLVLAVLPFVLFAPVTSMWQVFSALDVQAVLLSVPRAAPANAGRGAPAAVESVRLLRGSPCSAMGRRRCSTRRTGSSSCCRAMTALNLVVLLQFSIAGAGMYAFARTLGLWRAPAIVAALAYMFCGFTTARIVHLSIMSGAALVPAIFACVERMHQPRRRARGRWCAATAVALGCQAAAGHPQVPIYTAMAVGLLRRRPRSGTAHGRWMAASTASRRVGGPGRMCLAMAWQRCNSCRGSSSRGSRRVRLARPISSSSARPRRSRVAAVPLSVTCSVRTSRASSRRDRSAAVQAVRVWEHSAYVGILPLALAVAGLGHLVELSRQRGHSGLNRRLRGGVSRVASSTVLAGDSSAPC